MYNKKRIFFDNIKKGDTIVNDKYAETVIFNDVKEKVNINPLSELPNPIIRLYGFSGIDKSVYFDTENELIEYASTHNITYGVFCILDYLGDLAGKSNVIRKTYDDGYFKLYSPIDNDSCYSYNYEKSYCCGEYIWNKIEGNLNDEFLAFCRRDLSFDIDKELVLTKKI